MNDIPVKNGDLKIDRSWQLFRQTHTIPEDGEHHIRLQLSPEGGESLNFEGYATVYPRPQILLLEHEVSGLAAAFESRDYVVTHVVKNQFHLKKENLAPFDVIVLE